MPCDTVQTSIITWGPNTDPALIAKALEALGYKITLSGPLALRATDRMGNSAVYSHAERSMSIYGGSVTEAQVKQQYGIAAVRQKARMNGWNLTEKAPGKFVAQRRY